MDSPAVLEALTPKSIPESHFSTSQCLGFDPEVHQATFRYMAGENAYRRYRDITRQQLALVKVAPHLLDSCTIDLSVQLEEYREGVDSLDIDAENLVEQLQAANTRLDPRGKTAGKIRTGQNHLANKARGRVSYVPPKPEDVNTLMQDLAHFIARSDVDLFGKMLIGHAQFLCIHPFVDGNGRTSRALVDSFINRYQLAMLNPVLYRWKGNFLDYKSSLQAVRNSPLSVINHPFWQEAVTWASDLYQKAKQEKKKQFSQYQTKTMLAPLSPLAREISQNLWQTPSITPEYISTQLLKPTPEVMSAIDELVRSQILSPKVIKLPQHTQLVFELEEKFRFLEVLDKNLRQRIE